MSCFKKIFRALFYLLPIPLRIKITGSIALKYIDAGYGDTIMVTSVIHALTKRYNKISIICNGMKEEILRHNPNITAINQGNYGIDLNYHHGSNSVGKHFENNILDVMSTKVCIKNRQKKGYIFLTKKEINIAKELLKSYIHPIITIQTYASDFSSGRKEWDNKKWNILVKSLQKKSYTIIQLGTDSEKKIDSVDNYLYEIPIRIAAAVIKLAKLHIGIVSSLMHISIAVETPSLIIYGGFERYHNHYYKGITPIESNPKCSPCITSNEYIPSCPYKKICMQQINAESVIKEAEKILQRVKYD